jgi:hypothetical protein
MDFHELFRQFLSQQGEQVFPNDMWFLNCAIKSLPFVRMKFTEYNRKTQSMSGLTNIKIIYVHMHTYVELFLLLMVHLF